MPEGFFISGTVKDACDVVSLAKLEEVSSAFDVELPAALSEPVGVTDFSTGSSPQEPKKKAANNNPPPHTFYL